MSSPEEQVSPEERAELAQWERHALLARQLAQTGLLAEVCERLQAGLVQQWLASDPQDVATREQCYHEARAVDFVRHELAGTLAPPATEVHTELVESTFGFGRWVKYFQRWGKRNGRE